MHPPSDGSNSLGQPAPAVLAVAHTICDGLDGREPPRLDPRGALRPGTLDGRHRLLDAAAADPACGGAAVRLGHGAGSRRKGEALDDALRPSDRGRVRTP